MAVRVPAGWELRWHPASGGPARRLVIGRPARIRLAAALILASLFCAAAGSLAGIDQSRTRSRIAAVRAENRMLRARQAALRAHALEVTRQLEIFDRPAVADRSPFGSLPVSPGTRMGDGGTPESPLAPPLGATLPDASRSAATPTRR